MNSQVYKKLKIPDAPGVYFFKKGKETLYIGRATSLHDRTRSYFGKDLIETRGPLLVDMVFKADGIEWEQTDSVLEALILEANMIKKHQPYYNTKEKDDKSFNYVCITDDKLPKVIIIRGKDIQSTLSRRYKIYGPFPNSGQLKEALKIIRRIFPFIDVQSAKRDNAEFYQQLGLSPDVSDSAVKKVYSKNIHHLKLFFEGKKKKIISYLKKDMMQYVKKHQFERAMGIKRQIFVLEHINDVALLKNESITLDARPKEFRIESYDIAHMSCKNMVGVMTVVEGGDVNKDEYRKFIIKSQTGVNDTGALLEVLERRFGHPEWPMPKLIVVDGGVAVMNTALKFQERVGLKIPVVAVTKDEHHKVKKILGDQKIIREYEKEILLANSEAHRFAIEYHRQKRGKNLFS